METRQRTKEAVIAASSRRDDDDQAMLLIEIPVGEPGEPTEVRVDYVRLVQVKDCPWVTLEVRMQTRPQAEGDITNHQAEQCLADNRTIREAVLNSGGTIETVTEDYFSQPLQGAAAFKGIV